MYHSSGDGSYLEITFNDIDIQNIIDIVVFNRFNEGRTHYSNTEICLYYNDTKISCFDNSLGSSNINITNWNGSGGSFQNGIITYGNQNQIKFYDESNNEIKILDVEGEFVIVYESDYKNSLSQPEIKNASVMWRDSMASATACIIQQFLMIQIILKQ